MVVKRRTASSTKPGVLKAAQEIVNKSGIPMAAAMQVATGKKTLSEMVKHLQLKDKLLQMEKDGLLLKNLSGVVLAGHETLDWALVTTKVRKRKREKDYSKSHFSTFLDNGKTIGVACVGKQLKYGKVVTDESFSMVLEDREGEQETLLKHNIKFFFDASRKKQVLKKTRLDRNGPPVETDFLGKMQRRVDIKARRFVEAQEQNRVIKWISVEDDVIRGRVRWVGCYELRLEVSPETHVYLLRHAAKNVE